VKLPGKIRFPIVLKLVGVTVLLLLVATVWIAFSSSNLFESISGPREKDANGVAAEAKAAQVNVMLDKYKDKIRLISGLLLKRYATAEEKAEALRISFDADSDIVSLSLIELKDGKEVVLENIDKSSFLKEQNLSANYLQKLQELRPFPAASVFSGKIEIRNMSLPNGAALLGMGIPIEKNDAGQITHIAVAELRLEGIEKPFSRVTERMFYLVDRDGVLLAHPNDKFVLAAKNLGEVEVVKRALDPKFLQGESKYLDTEDKKTYIASYAKTQYGPAVIAQTAEDIILEPARYVRRKAFFITGLVLSGAIFLVFLFSMSITNPIERLVEVTRAVANGNFEVSANIHSNDEMGELATSFDAMVSGLKERDKMKNVLNKFHGSSVAEDMLKGDLQLGGVNKQVTVFFSDIRDFTKFSEGHSPEEVVGMLNEYFEIMVGIVSKNFGVVDKFVGDAMMAIWGAPNETGEDEVHAVRACLEMRQALDALNTLRIERGQVEIKIGMGLNSGPAISGTIGSSERMEYTVIGDTVNTASRIESSTKAFGTDLLISGETLARVNEKFITSYAGAAEVKGKAEPLKMYKVEGYFDENGKEVILKTKYSEYEAGHADKVKIA
jgi:adenylate cyclase